MKTFFAQIDYVPSPRRRLGQRMRQIGHGLQRFLGLLFLKTRTGPAHPDPLLNRGLKALRVLPSYDPRADESTLIQNLPWGSAAVAAEAPKRPDDIKGMWPQTSPFERGLYPVVLQLDARELKDHVVKTVLRYMGQVGTTMPLALWKSCFRPGVKALGDEQFGRIFSETALAQYLHRHFNSTDRAAFANFLTADHDDWAKIDFSGVNTGPAVSGVYVASTVTLLQRLSDGSFLPRAILCDGQVFTPTDGDHWVLARYHVLSAIHIQHTNIIHPRLHFPADTINALAKSLLPAEHLLSRLIIPHTRYTLGLNLAVLHHRRSVLWNSQREIYSALNLTTEALRDAVLLGKNGIDGHDSYRPYNFWGIPHDRQSSFGRYCSDWQEAFAKFARSICRLIDPEDPEVGRWADAIASFVPGFPDRKALREEGTLGRAVGRYLVIVTVLHSVDHASYAAIPIEYLPMRLRVPPPQLRDTAFRLNLRGLIRREDFFRHVMCHRMFFRPTVIQSLADVRYAFEQEAARDAVADFRREQTRLDRLWKTSKFPLSFEITSSIQY